MLSIKKMGRGSEDYYLALTEYFIARRRKHLSRPLTGLGEGAAEGMAESGAIAIEIDLPGEPAGRWMGRGCPSLGLHNEVFPEELKPLMLGFHPATGQPLVQNAGADNRVPGWDLTFSAPKSVSVAWSQAEAGVRERIEDAHGRSVAAAIALAEQHLAYSRIGKAGVGHVPVKLVAAAFEHGTSRNEDAQLHTHCLVLNVTVDAVGVTRALYSRPFFVNRNLLGAYYRADLADRLRGMGFRIRQHATSFEIVGVPQELLAASSTRRGEILAYLNKQGRSGAVASAVATLQTRRTKAETPPRSELFERWQDHNRNFGFDDVSEIMDPDRPQRQGTFQQAIDAAIARLADEASHFTKTDFLAAALQEAPARGLGADAVLREANAYLERVSVIRSVTTSAVVSAQSPQAHDLFDLGSHQGHQRYATREVLEEEQALLQTVASLQEREGALVPDQVVEMAIDDRLQFMKARAKESGKPLAKEPVLTPEQLGTVRHLTQDTLGSGAVRMVQGGAGTGKTDVAIAVAKTAWEEAGYKVIAATPTAKAARVLQRATGLDVQTITKALGDYELPWGGILNHHLRQLKNELLGKRTRPLPKPRPVPLKSNSIFLVDEAGMVGVRETLMIAQQVERSGATLILVGDANQLPPVGRGAPFQSLCQRVGCVELTDIQRQQAEWARQVAKLAAAGEVPQALQILAEHNAIHTSDNATKAAAAMVNRWAALGAVRNPSQAMMLANTNDECEGLNQIAQRKRLAENAISASRFVPIRDLDETRGIDYTSRVHVGDQVLITRNSTSVDVQNGMIGTVIGINTINHNVTVKFANGESAMIPAKRFPHLRLGYAVTTYKSQGDEHPDVLVLATESPQSQPAFYVQMTRAQGSTEIFTTKGLWNPEKEPVHKSPLAEYLSRQPDLRLASDLMDAARSRAQSEGTTLPPLEINFPKPPSVPGPATKPLASSRVVVPTMNPPPSARATSAPEAPLVTPSLNDLSFPDSPRRRDSTSAPAAADSAAMPMPTPPKPRRKKKKRPGEVSDAGTQEVIDHEEIAEPPIEQPQPEPETEAAEIAPAEPPAVLPVEFLIVPVPAIVQWRPANTNISIDRVPLLPRDFLTTPRRPIPRAIPSRIISPKENKDRQATPISLHEPQQISLEEARNPSFRKARQEKLMQAAIAQTAAEHNVPPDQIDIISVREWEEPSGDHVILWTEITFRIRSYGPLDLMKLIAFPI